MTTRNIPNTQHPYYTISHLWSDPVGAWRRALGVRNLRAKVLRRRAPRASSQTLVARGG